MVKKKIADNLWLTASKQKISAEDLKLHTLDILEGAFSMGNEPDIAFIQEYVGRHLSFRKLAFRGTPDIRIIVFNKIPVMAMLRLPTRESRGRANLHQGALGMDIAGSERSVSEMKRKDFTDYQEDFYGADNMILTIAGGVTEKETIDLAEKYFSKLVSNSSPVTRNSFKTVQNSPKIKLHNKKKEQTHVILGFLADGKNYKNKHAQTILSAILGGGMSSRMFTEVRERRGLAYAIRTSMDRYTDIGYMGTYAGLDTKKG